MKKEVSNKFKYFNFVFTLLIVLYHFRFDTGLNVHSNEGVDSFILSSFLKLVGNSVFLSMTMFFMISSFLFYFNIHSSKDAVNKMKKRLKTLLIPFLIWSLVCLLFKIVVVHDNPINSFYSIAKCLFFDPVDGPLWYVLALLIFMIPSPLIVKLKDRKILSLICLVFVLLLVELREFGYIHTLIRNDDWWWHGNMLGYIPAYAIGTFLGLNYSNKIIQEDYNTKKMTLFGMIAVIISVISIECLKVYANSQFYIYILFAVGLWLLLSSGLFKKDTPCIISCAFFMYAMHQPILIPIVNRITKILIKDSVVLGYQFILVKIVGVFLILIVSWVISIILKKILPQKIFFALSGGRN